MSNKETKVVEAEYTEVVEQEPKTRCEFTVGIDTSGNIYYRISGEDQSLIQLSGLLDYAGREVDRLWSRTLENSTATKVEV